MEQQQRKQSAVVFSLLLFLVGIGGGYFLSRNESDATSGVNEDAVQAVFLDNEQVYFGDITSITSETLSLENVYYLQLAQELQATATEAPAEQQPEESQNFQIVKLGNSELHGPEDRMDINREHVLFWENLKADSPVVKAIQDFEQQQQ